MVGMEDAHRLVIRTNFSALRDILAANVTGVCNFLEQNKILTKPEKQEILSKPTEARQAACFLYIIPTRGPSAFDSFYEATKHCLLYQAADILRPDNAPHEPNDDNDDDDYMDNDANSGDNVNEGVMNNGERMEGDEPGLESGFDAWNSEAFIQSVNNLRLEVKPTTEAGKTAIRAKYDQCIEANWSYRGIRYYPLDKDVGKRVLFLYDQEEPNSLDIKAVHRLFDEMFNQFSFNFEKKKVQSLDELNSGNFFTTTRCDCLILFVYATGCLCGEAGLDAILEPLKPQQMLSGKPKLIFRINKEPQPEADSSKDTTEETEVKVPVKKERLEIGDFKVTLKDKGGVDVHDGPTTPSDSPSATMSPDSDFLVIGALPHGKEDVLVNGGSEKVNRFIQSIVYTFAKHAATSNLTELLNKINIGSEDYILTVERSHFTRNLMFFPHINN